MSSAQDAPGLRGAPPPLSPYPGIALLLLLLPFAGSSRYNGDEFTLMSAALRIAQGDVPYRDFFEFVAPIPLALLAGAYKVFGASLATTHALMVALAWLMAWQAARLTRRLGAPARLAWLAAYVLVFGAFTHWPIYSHHWVALPFALAAIEIALIGLSSDGPGPWVAAGALTGATGLALQTDGASLGLALAVGIGLDAARRRGRELVTRLLALITGTGAVLALVAVALAFAGALASAWADIVMWPLTAYKRVGGPNDVAFTSELASLLNGLSNPAPASLARSFHLLLAYALFLSPLLVLVGLTVRQFLRPPRDEARSPLEAGFALVGCWAIFSALVYFKGKADFVHMSFHLAPGAILATAWGCRLASRGSRSGARWAPLALLMTYAITGMLMTANAIRKEPEHWNRPWAPDARFQESPAIRYLRATARPADRMAALPNGGFFYFYGPRPAVRHSLMVAPGAHYTSPQEFEAYWQEVATTRPRFVVVAPVPASSRIAQSSRDEQTQVYTAQMPAGYRVVGTFATPQFGPAWPAIVYQAD